MIKNITSFAASEKTGFRKELTGLYLTPTHVVATDSFRLIEVAHATGVTTPCIVSTPKNLKTFDGIAVRSAEDIALNHRGATYPAPIIKAEYPKYEVIFPKDTPQFTVRLNARYLKDMATAFENKPDAILEIAFHGASRPLVFSENTKTQRGLLMPIMR